MIATLVNGESQQEIHIIVIEFEFIFLNLYN